jgi:hypothetical protein
VTIESQAFERLLSLTTSSTLTEVRHVISLLLTVFEQGRGEAGFMLATLFNPENVVLSDSVKSGIGATNEQSKVYYEQAYQLLMREALSGNSKSMHMVAIYFQAGLPPVGHDSSKYEYWKNKAIAAGYRGAGQL